MTDLYFKCPCGKSLAVDLAGIGCTVRCVDCARPMVVPDPAFDVICPRCGAGHLGSADIVGDEVACTACRKHFIVPAPAECEPPPRRRRMSLRILAALPLAAAAAAIVWLIAYPHDRPAPVNAPPSTAEPGPRAAAPAGHAGPARAGLPEHTPEPEWAGDETETEADPVAAECPPHPPEVIAGMEAPTPAPAYAAVSDGTPPDTAGNQPITELVAAYRRLREQRRAFHLNTYNAEYAARVRAFREAFMDYTRTHSGPDLDGRHWLNTVGGLLWLSSRYEHESFEAADTLFRENLDTIAAARTDDPGMNRQAIFNGMLLHLQQWRRQAPVAACEYWLDAAAAMAEHTDHPGIRRRWGFSGGFHHLQVIFTSSAQTSLNPRALAAFRASRIQKMQSYLNDERIPLNHRTLTVCLWAAFLAGEHDGTGAIRILDAWQQTYGETITQADFFEYRMLYAFHFEADLAKAREQFIRAAQRVKEGTIEEGDPAWIAMADTYFTYLLLPDYEVKRQYLRSAKNG